MAATLGVETIQHTNGTTAVTVGTNGSVTAAGAVTAGGGITATAGTFNGTTGQITTDNSGHITSKQSLDVATAGGRFIGKSNRGELGQIAIEQTANSTDGGYIRFATSASGSTSPTDRMLIDGAGNVGIGVTAPTGILSIPAADTTSKPQVRFMSTGATNLADAALSTTDDSGGTNLLIGSNQYYSGGSIARFTTDRSGTAIDFGYTGNMKFFTGAGNAAPTERMRINSSGNLLVGTTTNVAANAKIFAKGSGVGIALGYGTGSAEYRHLYMNSGDGAMYVFNNTNYANLSASGAWTNASDRRIKKNIVDIKYGLEDVLKIQPRSYQMKEVSGDYIGLIAQEVEEIIPEVVSGDPEKQLTLDYGSLVAVAFKAIKELSAKNDALEARLAAVEA